VECRVHVIQVSHWYLFMLTLPLVQYVSSHYFEAKNHCVTQNCIWQSTSLVPLPSTPIHNLVLRYPVLNNISITSLDKRTTRPFETNLCVSETFIAIWILCHNIWYMNDHHMLWMIRNYISAQNIHILLADFPMHLSVTTWFIWKSSHTIRTCPMYLTLSNDTLQMADNSYNFKCT